MRGDYILAADDSVFTYTHGWLPIGTSMLSTVSMYSIINNNLIYFFCYFLNFVKNVIHLREFSVG